MSVSRKEIALLGRRAMDKIPGGPTYLEQRLWEFSEASPQGNKIITANVAGDPYLLRVYLTPDRARVRRMLDQWGINNKAVLAAATLARPYLHHFFRGDEDRETHDHPWRVSVSLILTSGYKEFRWLPLTREFEVRYLTPGSINVIKRHDYHRVELYKDQGCWTLFTSFGRVMESNGHDWEFLNTDTGERIPWGDWVQD